MGGIRPVGFFNVPPSLSSPPQKERVFMKASAAHRKDCCHGPCDGQRSCRAARPMQGQLWISSPSKKKKCKGPGGSWPYVFNHWVKIIGSKPTYLGPKRTPTGWFKEDVCRLVYGIFNCEPWIFMMKLSGLKPPTIGVFSLLIFGCSSREKKLNAKKVKELRIQEMWGSPSDVF